MASVTIYDVAAAAGVSIKTVSRVMNNEPSVSSATREKVSAAAQALGYSPNLSARSLAGSRSFIIAAFVDAALTLDHWRSQRGADYLSRIQLGAMAACWEAGYHFIVELVDNTSPNVRRDVANLLGVLKPDGVLLTPPSADDPAVLEVLAASGTAYVRLGPEHSAGGGLRVPIDDRQAAERITEHLIELGHRKIGFIQGAPHYGSSHARYEGFLAAMAAHDLEARPEWIRAGDFTFASGLRETTAMIVGADRPSAIFASNDDMALGAIAALAEAGLSAPDDVSVAGIDDSSGGWFSRPQLTTMRQPLVEMATYAVRALIRGEAVAGADREAEPGSLPPSELMVRRSTAKPA